jgi:glucose-6-phosphate 1-dehydrogenase
MITQNAGLSGKEPVAFVIFGITGDLTRRKLIPAIYELKLAGRLDGRDLASAPERGSRRVRPHAAGG